ncbi:hypothetical protein DFS34DRAFT_590489 [Phlyctochytrium arcticum]|nr:hypothetical protein DFS34DRAFT_590489 [Phlyctochytrium arcticum]
MSVEEGYIYCLFCGGPPIAYALGPGVLLFCGGPPIAYALGPGGISDYITEFAASYRITFADTHFLETVKVIFADTVTHIGSFQERSRTVFVHNYDQQLRRGVLPWRIDSEAPGDNWYDYHYTESEDESVDEEGQEVGYNPDYDAEFSCNPATTQSGALVHTICLRLFKALGAKVLSKSSRRPCVHFYDKKEEAPGEVQIQTLDLASAGGRMSGITYGMEEQSKEGFVFVPEKAWMLARPDRFPPVPGYERPTAERTMLRRQSGLERLPVEMLEYFLQTIVDGPDDPVSKGKTLLALAGTSPWLRLHITSNLWIRLCARSEFLPDGDRTDSSNAVKRALEDIREIPEEQRLQPKSDWIAYFFRATQSPSLRNRRRILRICEAVWDRLGYHRKQF